MKKFLTLIFATCMAASLLSSCSSLDEGPNMVLYSTIATFEGNEGPYSIYEYQKVDDSPIIKLTARVNIDPDALKPGSRTLITYSYVEEEDQDASGYINLMQITRLFTDTVTTTAVIPESLPYNTVLLQRSGTWLNLYCECPFVSNFYNRKFRIVADEATINDEYPQLYIYTEVVEGAELGAQARTHVSVSIDPIWQLPTCKGVDVHVYDNNAGADTEKPTVFTFKKSL